MSNQISLFMIPTPRPTVHELEQGLRHIFCSTSRNSSCQDGSTRQHLATTITRWTKGLSGLLQTHYQAISTVNTIAQSVSATHQTSYVGLLSSLNQMLEDTNNDVRRLFYESSYEAGIDSTFNKLLKISKSVRIEKEVTEFQDERQAFGW